MIERELVLYKLRDFLSLKATYQSSGIIFISAVDLHGSVLEDVRKNPEKYCIDISNWVEYLKKNRDNIHPLEALLNSLPICVIFVCEANLREPAMEIFRHNFTSYTYIETDFNDDQIAQEAVDESEHKKTIIEFTNDEIESVLQYLYDHLVGHEKFKKELGVRIRSFKLFNILGEQKVFSIFLMGESGIGKTEVGRLMYKALGGKKRLCKISFGNYSSKDSLNSLIGSPRGYIGSDTGELPMKMSQSDVGLILIDEFEKADNPVFNFFLDLLEEGRFTDSQSNVYDLNGYVIIFTSNLSPENYKKRLSPELRSRFDYVCQFQLLSDKEKKNYMDKRIEDTIQKFETILNTKIKDEDREKLYSKDLLVLNNLRKINRAIKEKIVGIAKNYIT